MPLQNRPVSPGKLQLWPPESTSVVIRRLLELEPSLGPTGISTVAQPMRVCVVSSGFTGPAGNGGIATGTSALAKQLVFDGHNVSLLYTYVDYGKPIAGVEHGKPFEGNRPWQHWIDELAADGICLEHVRHDGRYHNWRVISWLVKDFLGQTIFMLSISMTILVAGITRSSQSEQGSRRFAINCTASLRMPLQSGFSITATIMCPGQPNLNGWALSGGVLNWRMW